MPRVSPRLFNSPYWLFCFCDQAMCVLLLSRDSALCFFPAFASVSHDLFYLNCFHLYISSYLDLLPDLFLLYGVHIRTSSDLRLKCQSQTKRRQVSDQKSSDSGETASFSHKTLSNQTVSSSHKTLSN